MGTRSPSGASGRPVNPVSLRWSGRYSARQQTPDHPPRGQTCTPHGQPDGRGDRRRLRSADCDGVPGSKAAEIVLPKLADSLKEVLQQRRSVADDVERILDDHPHSRGEDLDGRHRLRTAARILIEIGDGSSFTSAGHLAAYAGIAPARATENSHGHCSCPRSQPCTTRPAAPTTTANAPKERNTTRPRSASPHAAAASCTPCSGTRRSTTHRPQQRLPANIGTPERNLDRTPLTSAR